MTHRPSLAALLPVVASLLLYTFASASAAEPGAFHGYVPAVSAAAPEVPFAAFANPAAGVLETSGRFDYVHTSPDSSVEALTSGLAGELFLLDIPTSFGPFIGAQAQILQYENSSQRHFWAWKRGFRVGLPMGEQLSAGLSWDFISGGLFDGRSDGNLGVLLRPNRFLSGGFLWNHLNRPERRGLQMERTLGFSLGLRPFGSQAVGLFGSVEKQEAGFSTNSWSVLLRLLLQEGLAITGGVENYRQGDSAEYLGVARIELAPGAGGAMVSSGFARGSGSSGAYDFGISLNGAWERSFMNRATDLVVVDLPERFPLAPVKPVFGDKIPSLLELRMSLFELSRNQNIKAVLFRVPGFSGSMSDAEELAMSVRQMKAAGKRVYFYLESGDNYSLFMAAHGDRTILNPAAAVTAGGFSISLVHLKKTLAAIGVKAQFVRAGKYKSAPEQFTRAESSPEETEAMNAYLYAVFGIWSRGFGKPGTAWLDTVPLTPTRAKELGLVDTLGGRTDIKSRLQKWETRRLRIIPLASLEKERRLDWGPEPRIAVVPVEGMILPGRTLGVPIPGFGMTGCESVIALLDKIDNDPTIDGILLHVNSPGGSTLASELIHERIKKSAKKRPLAAAFGAVAASGGYYISVPARRIFSPGSTATGSIGVYAGKFVVSGLLDKLRIHRERLVRGKRAALESMDYELNDEELAATSAAVMDAYTLFLSRVRAGRPLTQKDLEEVAQGRVWSGKDAATKGLVDSTGGSFEALQWLHQRLGGTRGALPTVIYQETQSFARKLLAGLAESDVLSDSSLKNLYLVFDLISSCHSWQIAPELL